MCIISKGPNKLYMDNLNISKLIDNWNLALQTEDAKKVVELYSSSAILIPTISNKVRHNHREIEDYFIYFLSKGPSFKIDESNIRLFKSLAVNSGIYTATFKDGSSVKARFTFVYQYISDRWLIIEHHSSMMPE